MCVKKKVGEETLQLFVMQKFLSKEAEPMSKTEELGVCSYPNCMTCIHKRKNCATFKKIAQNRENLKEFVFKRRGRAKECYAELKKILGESSPNLFSFGCGLGIDYMGARAVFRHDMNYFGIENSPPDLKGSKACVTLKPYLPLTLNSQAGLRILEVIKENCVICFFNSFLNVLGWEDSVKIFGLLEGKDEFHILIDDPQSLTSSSYGSRLMSLKLTFVLIGFNVTSVPILDGTAEIIKFQKIQEK